MALIYAFMGIVFLLLFIDEEGAIAVNILLSFPKDSILNVIVDIFIMGYNGKFRNRWPAGS